MFPRCEPGEVKDDGTSLYDSSFSEFERDSRFNILNTF